MRNNLERNGSKTRRRLDAIVSNAARTAKYLKKKVMGNEDEDEAPSNNIETFEQRTKRLLTDDPKQWHRFQHELRKNCIVTNVAVEQVFYHYIRIRATEEDIDACVNKWEQSQESFKKSLNTFSKQQSISRAA